MAVCHVAGVNSGSTAVQYRARPRHAAGGAGRTGSTRNGHAYAFTVLLTSLPVAGLFSGLSVGSTDGALRLFPGRTTGILTHLRASLPFPNGLESEGVQ